MSKSLRIADDAAAEMVWPAAKAAHLFKTKELFDEFRASGSWRVLYGPDGKAAVLERWRDHLDILAVRGIWASPSQLSEALHGVEGVAVDQGFGTVLSPLLPDIVARPYVAAGYSEDQRIVVLRANAREVAADAEALPKGVTTRLMLPDDIPRLIEVDSACFGEFWRYEPHRMVERLTEGRTFVAESGGTLIGYTHATIDRGSGSIGRLAVVEDKRRSGVGTALLLSVMHFLFGAGVGAVSLCTQEGNAASRALYARVGLREMPERLVFLTKSIGGHDGTQ